MKHQYILAEFLSPSESRHITVLPTYQAPAGSSSIPLPSGCLDGHFVCWCSPWRVSRTNPELQPLLRLLGRPTRS